MAKVIGMSHLISVLKAFSVSKFGIEMSDLGNMYPTVGRLSNPHGPIETLDYMLMSYGNVYLNPYNFACGLAALPKVNGSTNDEIFFCFMTGTEYFVSSSLQVEVPFDFVLPFAPNLPVLKERQILPYAFIEEATRPGIEKAMSIYMEMRKIMPRARLIHVFPPPPTLELDGFIFQHFSPSPELRERVSRGGISPPTYRLKYYMLYMEMLSESLKTLNVECMKPPLESKNKSGYLLKKYCLDGVHANIKYGELVLKQIAEYPARDT